MSSRPTAWGSADSLRQDLHDSRRRLILREAGALFSEVGFHNTSMEQIAARLGLTKTSLYYYFSDKSEILMRCLDLGQVVAETALEQATRADGNGLERITAFVQCYVEGITAELGACAAALELRSVPAEQLPALRARMRALDRRLRALIQTGIDDGSCVPMDAALAVNWIMGAMTLLPRWYRASSAVTAQAVALEYADHTRRMFAPRGTP